MNARMSCHASTPFTGTLQETY